MYVLYQIWSSPHDNDYSIDFILSSNSKKVLKKKRQELIDEVESRRKAFNNWSKTCKKIIVDYMTSQEHAINWDKVFHGWDGCKRGVIEDKKPSISFIPFWVNNTYQGIAYGVYTKLSDFLYVDKLTEPQPIFPKKPNDDVHVIKEHYKDSLQIKKVKFQRNREA